jgi:hypothetical protein
MARQVGHRTRKAPIRALEGPCELDHLRVAPPGGQVEALARVVQLFHDGALGRLDRRPVRLIEPDAPGLLEGIDANPLVAGVHGDAFRVLAERDLAAHVQREAGRVEVGRHFFDLAPARQAAMSFNRFMDDVEHETPENDGVAWSRRRRRCA